MPNAKQSPGQLMTVKQASAQSGIAETTIRNYVSNGYLKSHKISHYTFVGYRDLLRANWIARQKDLNKNYELGS